MKNIETGNYYFFMCISRHKEKEAKMEGTRIDVKGYVVGTNILVVDPRNDEVYEIRTGRKPTDAEWRAIQECLKTYAYAHKDPERGEE